VYPCPGKENVELYVIPVDRLRRKPHLILDRAKTAKQLELLIRSVLELCTCMESDGKYHLTWHSRRNSGLFESEFMLMVCAITWQCVFDSNVKVKVAAASKVDTFRGISHGWTCI
jgi:hypothetical protein